MTTATSDSACRRLVGLKTGTVTSDKRDKTRTVEVTFKAKERKYGKYMTHRTRFQVHDPDNHSHAGDLVEITACRPMSKTKTWRLVRVLKKSEGALG